MQRLPQNARAGEVRPAMAALAVLCGGAADLLLHAPQARHLLWGMAPDAAVLAVVWLALRAEAWAAAAGAFVLGFMRDGMSAGPAGGWALVFVLTALAVKAVAAAVEVDRTWSECLAAFAGVLAVGIVLYPILMYIYSGMSPVRVIYLYFSLYCIQGLTTALAGVPVFRAFDRASASARRG